MLRPMSGSAESEAAEVTLFLDGGDLYVTGDVGAIDRVLAEVLSPDDRNRRHSATSLADAAALGATVVAVGATAEEYLRLTRWIGKFLTFRCGFEPEKSARSSERTGTCGRSWIQLGTVATCLMPTGTRFRGLVEI
jgi:hypothetical protein